MSPKGSLAVVSFIALTLAANVASSPSASISFTHGPVAAGMPVAITVDAAPCRGVKVILHVDGQEIVGEIQEVPGTVLLNVPEGARGKPFVIEVLCPNARDSCGGLVI